MKWHIPYLLLVAACFLVSCNQAKLSDAREQYVHGEYYAASETYRKLYRKTPREQRALRGIIAYEMAENYRRLNQSARAVTAYSNAIRYQYPDTMIYLRYAQMLHREGKYTEAIGAYRDLLKLKPGNRLALNGVRGAEQAIDQSAHPTRHEVKRMDLLNSRRGEFSPMLARDDEVLYFTSSRDDARGETESPVTGMKYNDLYISTKNREGVWQKPERVASEINTDFDEGTSSVSPDGDKMFYTFSSTNPNHATSTEIYVSKRVSGTWTAGRPLEIVKGDSVSVYAHPAISSSGRYLYFVSDMPGGQGGKDIWRAGISEADEVFSIENLGPEINSPGNELFPYMRNDTTLYFSSDGHPGMGGLDLFEAVKSRDSDRWRIRNMQSPVNSSADDFSITFEYGAEKGFFSSNRGDVRGYDHIYSFEYSPVTVSIEGFAVDREDEFIPGATVTVIGDDGSQRRFITNRQGEYRFNAERGVDYLFMANADGFLNQKNRCGHLSSKKIPSITWILK